MAASLEQAFSERGFAEIGVDGLREATQVSLRTLYKYFPSREAMILAALEHRHSRYLTHLLDELPSSDGEALDEMFDRVGTWMAENHPRGCLFQAAVTAYPDNRLIRSILERHKHEVCEGMARATDLSLSSHQLLFLHEGLTQSWPLVGAEAVTVAKTLARSLLQCHDKDR